jgi:predicted RNase H-like nuclease (RuvC/YqgF family)
MKRFNIGLLILAGLLTGVAAAQSDSLAEAARKHRQQQSGKPVAAKVYTNDNLPATETISTVGAPTSDAAATAPTDGQAASADGSTPAAKDGAKPADDSKSRQKTWEDWREKIQKQKAAVEQMQKENEEIERQYKLTTGNYYSSAQQRLYDGAAMAKEDAAYKQQMEQKKKAIEDAKQKIEDLQEEARRAGVPSGYRD